MAVISAVERAARKAELSKRVVRASDAYQCCLNAETRTISYVTELISGFISGILEAQSGNALALVAPSAGLGVGRLVLTSEAVFSGPASATGLGLVVIVGAEILRILSSQTAALEAATGMAVAIGTGLQERHGDPCYDCVTGALMSQAHKRVTVTEKIRRRL